MRDFIKEINEKHPNLEVLEEIKSGDSKVRCRCKIDNYEWDYRPYDLLRTKGCHMCNGVPRYNTETFKKKMKIISPSIVVMGDYINAHTKIKCRCSQCQSLFEMKPNALSNGSGCKKCSIEDRAKSQLKPIKQFKKEVFEIVQNEYQVLGEYRGTERNIKMKHATCGEEFDVRPHNFLSGTRCPKCNGGVRKKTTNYYKKELFDLVGKEYAFLDLYKGNKKKHKYMHTQCGETFFTTPDSFRQQNVRCPVCRRNSLGEEKIKKFLTENNILFQQQKTFENLKHKRLLRFDFYLPALNICIEYDGRQHFEPVDVFGGKEEFELTKIRDLLKEEFCKKAKIKLIRISYKEKEYEKILKHHILAGENFEEL